MIVMNPEAINSRLRWRCRRGMLELDILLNDFLDNTHTSLNDDQKVLFDIMLDYPDQVLLDLLMGNMLASNQSINGIVHLINSHNFKQ